MSLNDLVEPEDPIDNGLQLALVKPAANEVDRSLEFIGIAARQRDVCPLTVAIFPIISSTGSGVTFSLSAP